ncbi:hypothetical protein OQA88_9225 [Cercophora sp. LCS_1]
MQLMYLLAFSILGSAIVIPPPEAMPACPDTVKEDRCFVNSGFHSKWDLRLDQSRWRTVFSAEGISPATYCQYWKRCGPDQYNLQCGFDKNLGGGTWFVDATYFDVRDGRSNQADQARLWYDHCLAWTREQWMKDYGCRTGSQ